VQLSACCRAGTTVTLAVETTELELLRETVPVAAAWRASTAAAPGTGNGGRGPGKAAAVHEVMTEARRKSAVRTSIETVALEIRVKNCDGMVSRIGQGVASGELCCEVN